MKPTVISFLLFLLSSCQSNMKVEVASYSFYHWTTDSNLTEQELNFLKDLSVNRLYYRYFDVDIDKPIGVLKKASDNPFKQEIIPCVFITNRTFKKINEEEIPNLAQKVLRKITEMHPYLTEVPIKTIQFDCDWTESTETQYFKFLEAAKNIHPKIEITSTLRLHQLTRKKETQIPPVNHGVLMLYNTSDLRNIKDPNNSILELNEVKKYIKHLNDYPIPLDLALPTYAWVIEEHNGRFQVLSGLLEQEFLSQAPENSYTVEDGLYHLNSSFSVNNKEDSYYFWEDTTFKFEKTTLKQLQEVARLALNHGNNPTTELIFYHLNASLLKELSSEELKSIQ